MPLIAFLSGLAAAMIWGGWFPITRLGVLDTLNIFDLGLLRYGVAGLIMLPLVIKRRLYARRWPLLGLGLILLGAGLPYLLLTGSGLKLIPVSHGILAPCIMALSSLLLSCLVWKTAPNGHQWASVFLIVMGAGLLISEPTEQENVGHIVGHALVMAGGFVWAAYTVALKYYGLDALESTAILSVLSGLAALPLWILFGNDLSAVDSGPLIGQGFYQGIMSGVLALFLYGYSVSQLGAARAALFAVLVPVFANIFAVPILGEWPSLLELIALLLLCLGLMFGMKLLSFKRLGTT